MLYWICLFCVSSDFKQFAMCVFYRWGRWKFNQTKTHESTSDGLWEATKENRDQTYIPYEAFKWHPWYESNFQAMRATDERKLLFQYTARIPVGHKNCDSYPFCQTSNKIRRVNVMATPKGILGQRIYTAQEKSIHCILYIYIYYIRKFRSQTSDKWTDEEKRWEDSERREE